MHQNTQNSHVYQENARPENNHYFSEIITALGSNDTINTRTFREAGTELVSEISGEDRLGVQIPQQSGWAHANDINWNPRTLPMQPTAGPSSIAPELPNQRYQNMCTFGENRQVVDTPQGDMMDLNMYLNLGGSDHSSASSPSPKEAQIQNLYASKQLALYKPRKGGKTKNVRTAKTTKFKQSEHIKIKIDTAKRRSRRTSQRCQKCGNYVQIERMWTHLREVHNEFEIRCFLCGMSVKSGYQRHMALHHPVVDT